MAPRNDPGKSDESPPQLRDVFGRANVVDEEATEEESSNDDDDDERGPEASGYAPIPMTPPPLQGEETEVEGEDNFADFDTDMSRLEFQQGQRPGVGELSPRVRSMAQADQWAHRREEARERVMVFSNAATAAANCPRALSMEMDPAKVESIRRAMAGISLPESAVPKWAKEMSDAEWHEVVTRKLEQRK